MISLRLETLSGHRPKIISLMKITENKYTCSMSRVNRISLWFSCQAQLYSLYILPVLVITAVSYDRSTSQSISCTFICTLSYCTYMYYQRMLQHHWGNIWVTQWFNSNLRFFSSIFMAILVSGLLPSAANHPGSFCTCTQPMRIEVTL